MQPTVRAGSEAVGLPRMGQTGALVAVVVLLTGLLSGGLETEQRVSQGWRRQGAGLVPLDRAHLDGLSAKAFPFSGPDPDIAFMLLQRDQQPLQRLRVHPAAVAGDASGETAPGDGADGGGSGGDGDSDPPDLRGGAGATGENTLTPVPAAVMQGLLDALPVIAEQPVEEDVHVPEAPPTVPLDIDAQTLAPKRAARRGKQHWVRRTPHHPPEEPRISCGPVVPSSPFDGLRGVANRLSLEQMVEADSIQNRSMSEGFAFMVGELRPRLGRAGEPSADTLVGIAQLHRVVGNTIGAIECLRSALAIRAAHPAALEHLGSMLFKQGYFADSETLLQRSVEAAPSSPTAHFALGEALLSQGKHKEGRASFLTLLAVSPGHARAQLRIQQCVLLAKAQSTWRNTFLTALITGVCVFCTLVGLYWMLQDQDATKQAKTGPAHLATPDPAALASFPDTDRSRQPRPPATAGQPPL